MLRRITYYLLSVVFVAGMVACGGKSHDHLDLDHDHDHEHAEETEHHDHDSEEQGDVGIMRRDSRCCHHQRTRAV